MNTILTLSQIKGIGRKTILQFLSQNDYHISDPDTVNHFLQRKNISASVYSKAREDAKKIEETCQKSEIHIITPLDEKFPQKLTSYPDSPVLLYYKGNIEKINRRSVAVIGTRTPTEWGTKISERLGYVLGRDQYNVVSGLAAGCDEHGHIGCLKANGYTIAVLPSGLNQIYPKKNQPLAEHILQQGGCLLSEYPPEQKAQKPYFVERDRIQSMLSDGLLVVEANQKSGTMHTVEYARQFQKRIGCYMKALQSIAPSGNQYLIDSKIAMKIENDQDLTAFKDSLFETISDRNADYQQLSLFQ